MKTLALAVVAATMAASTAFAHPVNEPHVCGVDPDTVMEYPGYAGKQGVWYDRGDYFFGFETVRFLEPVEYKSWSRVEGITTHHRLYKDDCRSSEIEIVHTETVDEVEAPAASGSAAADVTVATTTNSWVDVSYNVTTNRVTAKWKNRTLSYDGGAWWASNYQATVDAFSNRDIWNGQNSAGESATLDLDSRTDQDTWFKNAWDNSSLVNKEKIGDDFRN